MKVMQFMPEFGLAGAERMAESLCVGLNESGVQVIAVSFYDFESSITDNLKKHGIPVYTLSKRKGLDFGLFVRIRNLILKESPDIVHTHRYCMKYVVPACVGLSCKCVHTIHNLAEYEVPKRQQQLQNLLIKTNRVLPVAISPIVRTSISKRYGLNEDSVPLIYNGVAPVSSACQNSSDDEVFRLLHIGRFAPQKDHALLISVFQRVAQECPKAHLTMLGDGELRPETEKLVDELGLTGRVDFMGEVSDVSPYFASSSVFVLTSRYEGFPISLIESLSAGVPCVSTNVGGVSDIVVDGYNGLLCERDADSIAKAVEDLYFDSGYRLRLSRGAADSYSAFTRENMIRGYLKLYMAAIA